MRRGSMKRGPKGSKKKPPPPKNLPVPKVCPQCRGRKIRSLPQTPGGITPWRCPKCRAIGWCDETEVRVVDVGAPGGAAKPNGRPRRRRDRYT